MHKQREGVWEHAPPAQSRFLDFFLFDVSSATWKSANSHASDTQTHALTCRQHTSLLTQTRCRQKIKRDLLKVGGQQVRDIGGLGDAVVLFLVCVRRLAFYLRWCDPFILLSPDVTDSPPALWCPVSASAVIVLSAVPTESHVPPDSALDAPGIIIRIKSFQ